VAFSLRAQSVADTIIMKDGKIVSGSIIDKTSSKIKLLSKDFSTQTFSTKKIKKVMFVPSIDSTTITVELINGEEIEGSLLKRDYGGFIAIRNSEKGILVFRDNQIFRTFSSAEIKNESIGAKKDFEKSRIILKSNDTLYGRIVAEGTDNIKIRTYKYGDFPISKDEIVKTESLDVNVAKTTAPAADSLSKPSSAVNNNDNDETIHIPKVEFASFLSEYMPFAYLAFIPANTTYFLLQPGVDVREFSIDKVVFNFTFRGGIATDFRTTNIAFNICPLNFYYKIEAIPMSFEVAPNIYTRFFEGGSKTVIGIMFCANYSFNNNVFGFHLEQYNHTAIGISYYF